MPALSTFQRLPVHIAEAIASYYTKTLCTGGEGCNSDAPDTMENWTELYNVSNSWRVLALQHFFTKATIAILTRGGRERLLKFYDLPREVKVDTLSYHHFVKNVYVDFKGLAHPPNKKRMKDFASAWPEDLVFSSARFLKVDLSGLAFQKFEKNSADKNEKFYWLSQRINTSMPKLQEVFVNDSDFDHRHNEWDFDRAWKANGFLSTVFAKATNVTIVMKHIQLVGAYPLVKSDTGLTYLDWACLENSSLFNNIAERSASTLETLKVTIPNLEHVKSLVFSGNGKPIVYPQVRKLQLCSHTNARIGRKLRLDKSVVLFPALRHLIWYAQYVFEDDALFRGNSDTLEYMAIGLGMDLANILQRYNVFSERKYSKLSHIYLNNDVGQYETLLKPRQFVEFAIGLVTPQARTLWLDYDISYKNIIDAGSTSPYLANIQSLHVTADMSLYELVVLVKLLPSMVRLSCRPGDQFHRKRSNVNKLYQKYYPLSYRLKYWEFCETSEEDIHFSSTTAIMLAILCPNFSAVLIPTESIPQYDRYLAGDLGSGVYNDHINNVWRTLRIAT